jgi:hypothetical protein
MRSSRGLVEYIALLLAVVLAVVQVSIAARTIVRAARAFRSSGDCCGDCAE